MARVWMTGTFKTAKWQSPLCLELSLPVCDGNLKNLKEKTEVKTSDIDIRPESSGTDLRDQLKAACDIASAIERENDLGQAQRQLQPWSKRLGTLRDQS